jgi:hypothetical protein
MLAQLLPREESPLWWSVGCGIAQATSIVVGVEEPKDHQYVVHHSGGPGLGLQLHEELLAARSPDPYVSVLRTTSPCGAAGGEHRSVAGRFQEIGERR